MCRATPRHTIPLQKPILIKFQAHVYAMLDVPIATNPLYPTKPSPLSLRCNGFVTPDRLASIVLSLYVVSPNTYKLTRRKRKALVITDTELKLMAAAAIIGDRSNPKMGYSTPAATGTPNAL